MESRNIRQVARASQSKVGSCGHHERVAIVASPYHSMTGRDVRNAELSRNASAVSDAPRPTPEIYLPLTTGRVRYSCLKEAAAEEASMQIQWCCRDEKDSGNR